MGKSKIWKDLTMEVGNLITLLTLLLTIILGISDIRRRRAEADKLKSEARSNSINADTQIMTQIKQASIDLVNSLREEIDDLESQNSNLKSEVSYYRRILKDNHIIFTNFDSRPLPAIPRRDNEDKTPTGQV